MLVQKGELLIRDGKGYEVILADDDYFCVGKVTYHDAGRWFKRSVSTKKPEVYSNKENINTLERLGFKKGGK